MVVAVGLRMTLMRIITLILMLAMVMVMRMVVVVVFNGGVSLRQLTAKDVAM